MRGLLKGWDPLVNIVLDGAVEEMRGTLRPQFDKSRLSVLTRIADSGDPYNSSGKERKLGLVVARGTSVMTISPVEGTEEISNPFTEPEPQV